MKKLLIFFSILLGTLSYGQDTGSIKGKVLDGELFGEPLLMANISLKNTKESTTSNFHGNFSFENLTPGQYQLLIQFLGYEALEINLNVKKGEQIEVFETLHAKALSLPTSITVANSQQPSFEAFVKATQKP